MSKVSAILTIGALAGVGYYLGKKIFDKKQSEKDANAAPEVFVEERHSTPKEKLQRASLFAVGAIRTGTEKIKEGIDEIVDSDMISKGETTVEDVKSFAKETKDKTVAFAKEKSSVIKDEIDNLKSMVTSINTGAGETEEEPAEKPGEIEGGETDAPATPPPEEVGEVIEETAETIAETAREKVEELRNDFAAAKGEAATIAEEAADEIDSLSFDGEDTVSVDTFDFSSADKL
ncbi:MAG: hypothetical protein NC084_08970 [Bacteroides sp.]|nr:hypothetical protein [Eubacterium sp.]MCM1418346.1 hypothetical protein [Roseburia sp.]MCM1462828.1 hypothetical protein [Bacteroides sp.]